MNRPPLHGWHIVTIIVSMMAFAAFVLWITATKFDVSEYKSWLLLSGGYIGREIIPLIKRLLTPMSDTLARGGQTE